MIGLLFKLPTGSLVILGVVVLVGTGIMGLVSNMVLGERGSGVVINGILVTTGALLGVATQFWVSGLV